VLYLKLAVWPHPLVFDYGTHIIQHTAEIVPYALILAALLAVVMVALRYRPVLGFIGAWFFVILAPTSSLVPVAKQPMAEHRLYLSLAAVVVLVVLGLYRLIGRRCLLVCAAAAIGLGWLSVQRNKDYRNELSLWSDTVAKCPDNERAIYSMGCVFMKMPDRMPDAITAYEAALRINPDYAEAHYNLGNALFNMPGHLSEAITHFEAAVRLNPESVEMHNNLGTALRSVPGRLPEAIAQYEAAIRIDPGSVEAHYNLADALLALPGHVSEAIAQYKEALRLKPDLVPAREMLDQLQNQN
jgi:tetratricopeptide (TPR) repeat protein